MTKKNASNADNSLKSEKLKAAADLLKQETSKENEAASAAGAAAEAKANTTTGSQMGGAPGQVHEASNEDQKRLPDSAEKIAAFGNAAWLMMHTKTHKHLFVTDLEWACEPPIALGQCYFWHRGHVPVGFASWAYLSEEAEARMMQGVRKLGPADWKSGDRLWLMDLLVPFGGMQEAAKELRETIFKGQKVKSLQPAPDGSGMAVVEW